MRRTASFTTIATVALSLASLAAAQSAGGGSAAGGGASGTAGGPGAMGVGAGTSGGTGGAAAGTTLAPAGPSSTTAPSSTATAPAPIILRGGGTSGGTMQAPSRATMPGNAAVPDAAAGQGASGATPAPGTATPGSTTGTLGDTRDSGSDNAHWRRLAHNWKAHTGEVRRQWGLLTPSDVDSVGGDRGNLVRLLQQRYGVSAAGAETEVQAFERR